MSHSTDIRTNQKAQLDEDSTDAESSSDSDTEQKVRTGKQVPAGDLQGTQGETKAVKSLLERKSRRKLKKQRKLVEAGRGKVQDYFDIYGANPRAEIVLHPQGEKDKLKIQDVPGLVTWVLGEGMSPKWCFIKNKPLISKIVLLYVPGLDATIFRNHPENFPSLTAFCSEPRNMFTLSPTAEPSSTIQALLTCQVSRKRKERLLEDQVKRRATLTGFRPFSKRIKLSTDRNAPPQHGPPAEKEEGEISEDEDKNRKNHLEDQRPGSYRQGDNKKRSSDGVAQKDNGVDGTGKVRDFASYEHAAQQGSHPPSHYILTEEQMAAEEFPRAVLGEDGTASRLPPGYVTTKPASIRPPPHRMIAVDCEMCTTTVGLELTRVTFVDTGGKVLYDKLVVPPNPITDYNTKYSGITMKMLQGVETTLLDVQNDLLAFICADTILVGHSLVNDLQALKLVHRRAIDTAVIFPHPRGPPFRPALRMLAERFLRRRIQGLARGHDSAEDARAAMDLALLKIRHGPQFGCAPPPLEGESLLAVLARRDRRSSLIDRSKVLQRVAAGPASVLPCTSDSQVLTKTIQEAKSDTPNFVWSRFADIITHHEQAAKCDADLATRSAAMASLLTCTKDKSGRPGSVGPPPSPDLVEVLKQVDERIGKLHLALKANTMLLVASGHGDTPVVRRLQEAKWKRIQGAQPGLAKWDNDSESILQEFQHLAKAGLLFAGVKQ